MCGHFYFSEYSEEQKEAEEYVRIKKRFILPEKDEPIQSAEPPTEEKTAIDFDGLLAVNDETVGWIEIEGTPISYPVLQAEDNEKYLDYSFYEKRANAGAIFMDCENSAYPLDRNTILYGHHLKNSDEMFGSLLKYKDRDYLEGHSVIRFDTIHKSGEWRIFAVLHIDASGSFNYLRQRFSGEDDFNSFIDQVSAMSLVESDVVIEADNDILTLSTCDGSKFGKDGRLVVMAVREK